MKFLVVFSLLVTGVMQLSLAQSSKNVPTWAAWGHGGIGAGVAFEGGDEFGLLRAAHFGGNLAYKHGLLSYTYTKLGDFRNLKNREQNAIDVQEEQAILIGVGKQTEKTKYFLSTGYSWGKGTYYFGDVQTLVPADREKKFTYHGIPIRVTFVRSLTPWLGLGMETTANTNKDYPYLTLLGTLVLGKL